MSLSAWRQALETLEIERCVPPFWARGGHAQTIVGHFTSAPPAPPGSSLVWVDVSGGDRLALHHHPGIKPIVLLLCHGLGGDGESDYILRFTHIGLSRGYHLYRLEHRSCGAGYLEARGPYHSGRSDDLARVVATIRERHPTAFVVAIGYSLSGNALLLLNAGVRGSVPPDLAIAVNAPIHLDSCVSMLERGFNRVYDIRFAHNCGRTLKQRYRNGMLDRLYRVPLFSGLRDVDEIYTAPAAGFRDADDYYAQCSAAFHLGEISVPTIALTALDDPMVDAAEWHRHSLPETVHLHLEPHGGHLGYLHHRRTPLGNRQWLDYALDRYLETSLAILSPDE